MEEVFSINGMILQVFLLSESLMIVNKSFLNEVNNYFKVCITNESLKKCKLIKNVYCLYCDVLLAR